MSVGSATTAPGSRRSRSRQAVAGANGGVAYFDTGGQSKSRNMLTGLLNPSYVYNDNILLYTLFGRGEKAGAVNVSALPIFNSASQFQGFQPVITKAEYSWDYEIGAKTKWLDEKLIFTTNFYWTDIFNFQANIADASYTNANGTPLARPIWAPSRMFGCAAGSSPAAIVRSRICG